MIIDPNPELKKHKLPIKTIIINTLNTLSPKTNPLINIANSATGNVSKTLNNILPNITVLGLIGNDFKIQKFLPSRDRLIAEVKTVEIKNPSNNNKTTSISIPKATNSPKKAFKLSLKITTAIPAKAIIMTPKPLLKT